jgi:glycosyltransferase involved in cell wall biosynthesis
VLISVSPRREACGVSVYAGRLETALRAFSEIQTLDLASLNPPEIEAIDDIRVFIVHDEIGTDLKSHAARRISQSIRVVRKKGGVPLIYLHSTFSASELDLPKPLALLAVEWQFRTFRRWASSGAILVVPGETARRRLEQRGIACAVVPLGVPRTSGEAPREEREARIGLVGHPYRSKRFPFAVQACAELPEPLRSKIVLVVVGGDPARDSEGERALQGALKQSQLRYEVHRDVDDARFSALLSSLALAVFPYEDRGSGSAALDECLGMGVPGVVSDSGAFTNAVDSGAAIRVDEWPRDATAAIERELTNETVRAARRAAIERYVEASSIDASARMLAHLAGII